MKLAKGSLLLAALLAMMISIMPLSGQTGTGEEFDDFDPGGGSSSGWTVYCTYDAYEHLVSKECVSGGSSTCSCP